ncbi:Hypothetical protein J6896_01245 [Nakaseomyces glabratus]|nr:hypothetical protein J7298_01245 [Nakaseomyces glabratus]KAH7603959.1 hypothetical protein J7295_01251 [Nakaseomyces glabratus]KAH7604944.1 hypothetical protein J7294_01237 [Nakaseomyces glabratus]KAH7607260.1 hypothetical protein J7293_01236 [Nakaseomyces glabratus]KAH7613952.1 hypothetical protein J7292_01226 [Nakaseomyces glabratus]
MYMEVSAIYNGNCYEPAMRHIIQLCCSMIQIEEHYKKRQLMRNTNKELSFLVERKFISFTLKNSLTMSNAG